MFFNLFLEVFRHDKLEQFEFELEKIIGIWKHSGKVRNFSFSILNCFFMVVRSPKILFRCCLNNVPAISGVLIKKLHFFTAICSTYQHETIHLKHQQIFMIFYLYPTPILLSLNLHNSMKTKRVILWNSSSTNFRIPLQ